VDSQDLRRAQWRKSTYSANGSTCVEVGLNLPDIVAIRDSKNPDGPALAIDDQAWSEFIQGIKRHEFDL
jgi:predicted secreted Zn-dependent protease